MVTVTWAPAIRRGEPPAIGDPIADRIAVNEPTSNPAEIGRDKLPPAPQWQIERHRQRHGRRAKQKVDELRAGERWNRGAGQ